MKSKINMKMVAEKAGVSVATVSRVINHNGRFSAETEAEVRRIIAELDYHPNIVAKSLRENNSKVVGVIVPDITNLHFSQLVLELENCLFDHGYATMICNTNESDDLERKHMDMLISRQVSGIIFISGKRHYHPEHIPTIYMDRPPENHDGAPDCIVVASDNRDGGYLAAKSLIDKGCRHIAAICPYHVDLNHKLRYEGYQAAMDEAGLEANMIELSANSANIATSMIKAYLQSGKSVDGLVCTTDTIAVGAIIGLGEMNIKIPDQVRVTGYDDSTLAALYNPSLTSIHQPIQSMSQTAVNLLLNKIEHPSDDMTDKNNEIKLPVSLIERESSR